MSRHHVAGQGDCIHSIAAAHGLPWQAIWDHRENQALRARRSSPSVLHSGDVVFVPDPEGARTLTPGAHHRFRAKRPRAPLRVRLVEQAAARGEGGMGPAQAGIAYRVTVGSETHEGTTDGEGYVECTVPASATEAVLTLEPGTPREQSLLLRIGHLDPLTEASGVEHRLRNLGFQIGERPAAGLGEAIAAFQRAHGLAVTGDADAATTARLVEVHGT